jgi:hypothetical protein
VVNGRGCSGGLPVAYMTPRLNCAVVATENEQDDSSCMTGQRRVTGCKALIGSVSEYFNGGGVFSVEVDGAHGVIHSCTMAGECVRLKRQHNIAKQHLSLTARGDSDATESEDARGRRSARQLTECCDPWTTLGLRRQWRRLQRRESYWRKGLEDSG